MTTTPVALAGAGLTVEGAIERLGAAHPGDLFVQVDGDDADAVEAKVRSLSELLSSRLMFALPPTPAGLEVMGRLRDERIWTAATSLVGLGQGLLAAGAGADVLIPSFDRIRAAGGDPVEVVRDLVGLSEHRGGRPRVLVATVTSVEDVSAAARAGAWGATMLPSLAAELIGEPGTSSAAAGEE